MTEQPYLDDGAVHAYIERMERALAGPRWTVPNGLMIEQILQFITDCADGLIPPDVRPPKD